jgi:hypothetical protein|tara:strand:+ start:689 stop:1420 length:732 start_codon:yes stop_codon:yes gene_type:complete
LAYIGKTPTPIPLTSSDITNGIVTGEKLNADVISSQTELATAPADTDEFLISDAGVLKRLDSSLIGGGQYEFIATADYSSGVSNFTLTDCFTSTYQIYQVVGHNLSGPSGEKVFVQILDSGGSAISGWDHIFNLAYVEKSSGNGGESYSSDNNLAYFKFMNYNFSGNSTEIGSFNWTFYQPYDSVYTQVGGQSQIDSNNGYMYVGNLFGMLPSTTSGRSLKFYTSSGGNFAGYKVTVYGMKRS